MTLQEQVIYGLIYLLVWGVIYFGLYKLRDHHLFRTDFQRINWLSFVHYLVSTPLIVASFFIDPPALDYGMPPQAPLLHAMLILLTFYLIGAAHALFFVEKRDNLAVIHHLAFGFVLCILLAWGNFPRFWMLLYVAQTPGVLFHPLLAMRKSEKVSPHFLLKFERIHFWVYIFFRHFFQFPFIILSFYLDYVNAYSPYYVWLFLGIPTSILVTIFTVIWTKKALIHLREEERKLLAN